MKTETEIQTRVRYIFKDNDESEPTIYTYKDDLYGSFANLVAGDLWLMEHTIAWVETRVVIETETTWDTILPEDIEAEVVPFTEHIPETSRFSPPLYSTVARLCDQAQGSKMPFESWVNVAFLRDALAKEDRNNH